MPSGDETLDTGEPGDLLLVVLDGAFPVMERARGDLLPLANLLDRVDAALHQPDPLATILQHFRAGLRASDLGSLRGFRWHAVKDRVGQGLGPRGCLDRRFPYKLGQNRKLTPR